MASPRRSIAILGCGPAGMAAALSLTRAGHDCHLYERFGAPAPVGSGLMLQPTGLAVLDDLGLGARVGSLGNRIDRILGRLAPAGKAVLDVRYDSLGQRRHGLGIHRAALFDVLHDAVLAANVPVSTGIEVAAVRPIHGKVHPVTAKGLTLAPYDLVVDAMGARSPLSAAAAPLSYGALWATLPWMGGPFNENALEQRYRKASTMVGVLPIGTRGPGGGREAAFFWSLRRDRLDDWRQAGLATWKDEVRRAWPETEAFLGHIVDAGQLTFANYAHRTFRHDPGSRIVAIGDAFHSTSPQLGQGVNMALLDVHALNAALDSMDEVPDALRAYEGARASHVRLYQAMSRALTPFYQSDGRLLPLVRDHVVPALAKLPPARWMLASMVAGTLGLSRSSLPTASRGVGPVAWPAGDRVGS